MAARANTGDQRTDRRVAEIVEYFLCSRACMDLPVAVIVELAGHPGTVGLFDKLLRTLDSALHAAFLGREIEGGAVGEHKAATFDAHAFRHNQDKLVALDRGGHGKSNAGIAARR